MNQQAATHIELRSNRDGKSRAFIEGGSVQRTIYPAEYTGKIAIRYAPRRAEVNMIDDHKKSLIGSFVVAILSLCGCGQPSAPPNQVVPEPTVIEEVSSRLQPGIRHADAAGDGFGHAPGAFATLAVANAQTQG